MSIASKTNCKRRIVVIGDSHTEAIKAGFAAGYPTTNENHFFFHRIWKTTTSGEIVGDTTFQDALKIVSNLTSDDIVALCLLGTAHNIFGLLQHEQPFDLFVNGMTEPSETTSVIPQNTLRDMFVSILEQDKKLSKIRDSTACQVVHLSTPPPKADNDFILSKLRRYRGHKVSAITPADTRLKMWTIENDALKEFCARRRIQFAPPPEEALAPDGFLRANYYGGDATHANGDYGKLILKQLEKMAFENSTPVGGD